ncbi:MAG: hypothetical protein IE887_03485 [Campylobacterales bacterium]|nr:hypothetical protein [Campylobacterales bacterium]
MNILVTKTYEAQLQDILNEMIAQDSDSVKKFKTYLDAILINMPTKVQKYKSSELFDDDEVKEIEHEGFVIPFYHNKQKNTFVVLGIIRR